MAVRNLGLAIFFYFFAIKHSQALYRDDLPELHDLSPNVTGNLNSLTSTRNPKFFPLFTLVRFTNEACRTNTEEMGVCYTRPQCSSLGGLAVGTCARGLGVCCQFYSTCGSIVNQNQTFFRNPDYPNKYRPTNIGNICQIRVRKQVNSCQLRLNFIKFDIDGPNAPAPSTVVMNGVDAGNCKNDMLTLSSQATGASALCGNLDGQHLYLEFGSSDTITLNIILNPTVERDREWNIEMLMIPCRSELRAPPGCLQYFQGISGQVESFNNKAGTHLGNQAYSICVRVEEGMRSIDWSACTQGDVKFTGPTPLLAQPAPGTAPPACSATNSFDFLIIPGGIANPLVTQTAGTYPATPRMGQSTIDRFCDVNFGYANTFIRSNIKPFLVTVKTDDLELPLSQTGTSGDASVGFCLKWQQSPTN